MYRPYCSFYLFIYSYNLIILFYEEATRPYGVSSTSAHNIRITFLCCLHRSALLRFIIKHFYYFFLLMLTAVLRSRIRTLLKKTRMTQQQNARVTENSVNHIDWAARSMMMTDFSDRSLWMTKFSIALVLCSCVTLGFCNSVRSRIILKEPGPYSDMSPHIKAPAIILSLTWINKYSLKNMNICNIIL
jgi:hypothetical protein